jgi:mono/diheme cytochrome c family protein
LRLTAIGATLGFLVAGAAAAGSSPPALYTGAQAAVGSKAYDQSCAQCHGAQLEGGVGPALTGPNLRTLAAKTKLTVGDLYDFMSQQMPMNAPASLTKQQYTAILAYILKFNGYPGGSTALTASAADASKVIITSYK